MGVRGSNAKVTKGLTKGSKRTKPRHPDPLSSRPPSALRDLRVETPAGPPESRAVAPLVAAWFKANARPLPWRTPPGTPRDPYLSLVSEAMLQQTQVARVVERWPEFLARFPTIRDLAASSEDDVLALWSGMGYYRRARNLHAAARRVVAEFGGAVPDTVEALRTLPGVGRYTAGAIASIAHGRPEPLVDGNVARVLLRVHGRAAASDDRAVQPWLWDRARELAEATPEPGAVNEGLMELGATVCVPVSPRCPACPLRDACVARREGLQDRIPLPKSRPERTVIYSAVAALTRAGSLLVEQRGHEGMWAGLWQAPTIERTDRPPTARELADALGLPARSLSPDASFEHGATHRRLLFQVWRAELPAGAEVRRGLWLPRSRVEKLGLATPQRKILLGGVSGTLWE